MNSTEASLEVLDVIHNKDDVTKDSFDWDKATHYVYAVVCVGSIIGIGLNLLCFKTSLSMPRAKSVASILMRHLAFWDSAALVNNLVGHGIGRILGTGWICKQAIYFKMFTTSYLGVQMVAIYHILALALDRAVAIKAPIWHKNNVAAKPYRTVWILQVVIVSFCFACASPRLFVFVKHENGHCGVADSKMDSGFVKWAVGFSTFGAILTLPHVGYLIANYVFVRSLTQRQNYANKTAGKTGEKDSKSAPTNQNEKEDRKQKNQRSYITMLILLTFGCSVAAVFAGLTNVVPYALGEKSEAELLTFDNGYTGFSQFMAGFYDCVSVVKNSMNFLLYMISGDVFRKAFKRSFGLESYDSNISTDASTSKIKFFISWIK